MSIVDQTPIKNRAQFVEYCEQEMGIKADLLDQVIEQEMLYNKATAFQRNNMRQFQTAENRWYASLDAGNPDFSVYDTQDYLGHLWACWAIYSRRYIKDLHKGSPSIVERFGTLKSIVDVGCGFGYSTLAWRQLHPNAIVYGTNLENTHQIEVARRLAAAHDFHIVTDFTQITAPVDLVFASEYFEHFESPITHLQQLLTALRPRNWVIANAFGAVSLGHFNRYRFGAGYLDSKHTAKKFNDLLRSHGYQMLKTKMWNNRPQCWSIK